ncbi:hypothetical protein ACK348_07170, partial [Aeromonas veronii]
KSAQIREILISESAWEEMTCLFAPSLNDGFEEHTHGAILLLFRMRMFILPIYQLMASLGSLFISQSEK